MKEVKPLVMLIKFNKIGKVLKTKMEKQPVQGLYSQCRRCDIMDIYKTDGNSIVGM